MNRYFSLRDEVLHLLDEKSHGYYKREAIAHMFQVETLCLLLAKERNLDDELCAIIGLLHDIGLRYDGHPFLSVGPGEIEGSPSDSQGSFPGGHLEIHI